MHRAHDDARLVARDGAPAGSAVVVTMTGPGLPPSDMFTIGTDGSFGKDYAVPAGAGVWTTKVVTIGGSPAPAANSSNRSTATCDWRFDFRDADPSHHDVIVLGQEWSTWGPYCQSMC